MPPFNNNLVTVIIATYNREEYLAEAIDSCLLQQQVGTVIVIDDGSTAEVHEYLEARFSDLPNVVLHRFCDNKGSPRAFNKGLELARDEYITFLGDDDVLAKDRFGIALQLLRRHQDIDGVYDNVYSYDSALRMRMPERDIIMPVEPIGDLFNFLIKPSKYHMSLEGMVLRTSKLAALRFDTDLRICQDTDFIWKVALELDLMPCGYSTSYLKRRIHTSNVTRSLSGVTKYKAMLYGKWLDRSMCDSDLRRHRWFFYRQAAHHDALDRYGLDPRFVQKLLSYAIMTRRAMISFWRKDVVVDTDRS